MEWNGLDDIVLRISPMIDYRNLLNAADRAVRRARFLGEVFALDIGEGVLFQGYTGVAALL